MSKDELEFLKEQVERAKDGDEQAFSALYEHFYQPIHRFIYYRTNSLDDADDLAQQVFLKFYANLSNWQDIGYSPSAYLYTIARSVIADHYRKKRPQVISSSEEILPLLADQSQTIENYVIDKEEVAAVYEAIARLPDNYSEILLLRFSEGLPSREIAEIVGKTDQSVRKIISRGIIKLKEIVEEDKQQSQKNNKLSKEDKS